MTYTLSAISLEAAPFELNGLQFVIIQREAFEALFVPLDITISESENSLHSETRTQAVLTILQEHSPDPVRLRVIQRELADRGRTLTSTRISEALYYLQTKQKAVRVAQGTWRFNGTPL